MERVLDIFSVPKEICKSETSGECVNVRFGISQGFVRGGDEKKAFGKKVHLICCEGDRGHVVD